MDAGNMSIEELYTQENVGTDKFEPKIEELKQQIKELTPTAEDRLYDCIFRDKEERIRKRAEEGKQISVLKDQLSEYKNKKLKTRLTDRGHGIGDSRIFPSKELQDKAIEENMDLLKIYAGKYSKSFYGRIEYKELYQTASLGLVKAAISYIPLDKATFRTYASRCINNEIIRTYGKSTKKRNATYEEMLIKMNILLIYLDLIEQKKTKHFFAVTAPINMALAMAGFERYSINRKNKKELSKEQMTWKTIKRLYGEISRKTEISQMITSEERNTISLEIEYERLGEDEKTIATLRLIIKRYMHKLANSMIFDRVYKSLVRENPFVTEDMVIRKANEFIQKANKRAKELNAITAKMYERTGFRRNHYYKCSVITIDENGIVHSREYKNFHGGIVLQLGSDIERDYQNTYSAIIGGFDSDDEIAKYEYYARVLDKIDYDKEYSWTPQIFYRDKLDQLYTEQRDSYIHLMETDLIPARDKNYEDEETLKEALDDIDMYVVYKGSDVNAFVNTLDPEIRGIARDALEQDDIEKLRNALSTIYEKLEALYSKAINHDKDLRKRFIRLSMCEVDHEAKFKIHFNERSEALKQENNEAYKACVIGNIGLRKWDEDTLEEIREFNRMNSSLGIIISDGEIEEKEYKTKQTLEEQVEGQIFISDYKKCLCDLDPTEQSVLEAWYDEEFKQAYSAKEIAKELGKKSKEVEKIRDKAFQKIKNNPIMQKYKEGFIE